MANITGQQFEMSKTSRNRKACNNCMPRTRSLKNFRLQDPSQCWFTADKCWRVPQGPLQSSLIMHSFVNNTSLFTINHPQGTNKTNNNTLTTKNTWEIVKGGRRGYPFLVHLLNIYSNKKNPNFLSVNSKLYTIEYLCIIKVQNSN